MPKCLSCNQETNNQKFCSRSCAAKHNNKIPKRKRRKYPCQKCGALFYERRKYCDACRPPKGGYRIDWKAVSEKQCPMCRLTLPKSAFYKRRTNKQPSSYCIKCSSLEVFRRNRKIKQLAVNYKGGKCSICSYHRSLSALEFHHVAPEHKDPEFKGCRASQQELDKCILVCSNCHREIHDEMRCRQDPRFN